MTKTIYQIQIYNWVENIWTNFGKPFQDITSARIEYNLSKRIMVHYNLRLISRMDKS